ITQISVKDKTEALFYVQAPFKVDLQGDMSYQYQWVPMLRTAKSPKLRSLPGKADEWLSAIEAQIPDLLRRGQQLGFGFTAKKRPQPNAQGRVPTTMEWAKRLTDTDIQVLRGQAPYSEKLPDIDAGLTKDDLDTPEKYKETLATIRERMLKARQDRPGGY